VQSLNKHKSTSLLVGLGLQLLSVKGVDVEYQPLDEILSL